MSNNVIETNNLVKYYGGRRILDDINLKVPQGCIYGLLGRNGVGKTTLIRILLGLEEPTRGTSSLLGCDSMKLSADMHGNIGYVAEGHNLIQSYRVDKLIRLCKSLSPRWNQEFFEHLLETFKLPMDRKIKQLSAGMRAQLNLSLAMAIEPKLLIFDDPTLGLDTLARRQFIELAIDLLTKEGRSILFSSHILSDVERIADRIGILVAGRIVVDCSLDELKTRIKKLRLIFDGDAPTNLHITDIINQQVNGRELIVTFANLNEQKRAVIETFKPVSCIDVPMSLEDIFIECTNSNPLTFNNKQQEV